jgi:hypothetical protein
MSDNQSQQRVLSGSVLLTPVERDALKRSAQANSRKITDQMRWYIVQSLKTEGYLRKDK